MSEIVPKKESGSTLESLSKRTYKGTYNFHQILGNETLIIAYYKYAKIFKFAMLGIKL